MTRRPRITPTINPAVQDWNADQEKASSSWRIEVDRDGVWLVDLRRDASDQALYQCQLNWQPISVLEINAWLEGYWAGRHLSN